MKQYLKDYINNHGTCYIIKTAKIENNQINETTYIEGNAQVLPVKEEVTLNHYFDIASLTKTFTAICVHKSAELKLLNLDDTIYNLNNNFKNLKEVTVRDLLCHRLELWTNGYLGRAKTKEEFYQMLFDASIKTKERTYIDSHFIILSIILETIHNKPFKDIVKEYIIKPLNLKNTTFKPINKQVVSCNYEIKKDGTTETEILPGIPHDTKARVAYNLGIEVGHAGIFTTTEDLFKVLLSFIDDKYILLKEKTINEMLKHDDLKPEVEELIRNRAKELKIELPETKNLNKLFKSLKDEDFIKKIPKPYNYMSTRYKHFIKDKSDLIDKANSKTITFSGFTGPICLIDFKRKIVILIMTNAVHNSNMEYMERFGMAKTLINNIYENML